MPANRPAPVPKPLREFLAAYSPPVRALTLHARAMLLARHPALVEHVWPGWKMIGYGTGSRRSDMVIGLGPAREHLAVHLMGGFGLPDPAGLLEGTSRSSRHVRITSAAMLDSEPVQRLIDGAFLLADAQRDAPATVAKPATTGARPVGDNAVAAKTGRTWDEWLQALDAAGCQAMSHKDIVAVLGDRFGVGPWWQQMVTVGYERARGLRQVHETTAGYQVGASKTIGVGVATVWRAWNDARMRKRWLPDGFTIRKATEPKSMRITWNDGTDLQVLFYDKGTDKSQVTIDHRKLAAAQVEAMKAYWKERVGALKELLEAQTV